MRYTAKLTKPFVLGVFNRWANLSLDTEGSKAALDAKWRDARVNVSASPIMRTIRGECPFSALTYGEVAPASLWASVVSRSLVPQEKPDALASRLAELGLDGVWQGLARASVRNVAQWAAEASYKNHQLAALVPENLAQCVVMKAALGETMNAESFLMVRGGSLCMTQFHFKPTVVGNREIPLNADQVMAMLPELKAGASDEVLAQVHKALQLEYDSGKVAALLVRLSEIKPERLTKNVHEIAALQGMQLRCEQGLHDLVAPVAAPGM